MRLSTGKTAALAFFLGAITVLGYAPFHLYFIPLITLTTLFLSNATRPAFAAFCCAFSFSLGLLLAGVNWIYVSLHQFGGMSPSLGAIATILFCVLFSFPFAFIQWILHRINVSIPIRFIILFPVGIAIADWTRGWFLSGFPWLSIGYSQIPESPLASFAPVLGVYGVSLATAICSGSIALTIWQTEFFSGSTTRSLKTLSHQLGALFITVILALILGLFQWTQRLQQAPTLVSLIQGNISQEIKWSEEWAMKTLDVYLKLIEEETSDLILLPETAIPIMEENVPQWFWQRVETHSKQNRLDVVLGIPERTNDGKYFNSVIHVQKNITQRYRKHHLVPFGDYFPFRSVTSFLFDYLNIPMSNFSAGPKYQPTLKVANHSLGIDICYEDVFGEEIIRHLPEATLLANFTNDAWWGNSIGPHQHLQIAQTRALESGRELLRATNTGITAFIDHRGYVTKKANQFSETVLRAEVYGRHGSTPFSKWGNYAFLVISMALLSVALISTKYRGRGEKR